MAKSFDPADEDSWFFGQLNRERTDKILNAAKEDGVFLIRACQSKKGNYVLCVREGCGISHYIIEKANSNGQWRFVIGDSLFPDVPSMLNFYKTHYLETTYLKYPAPKEKVIANYNFQCKDREQLSFRKGEILDIIGRDEEKWWMAKNKKGHIGKIPAQYVTLNNGSTTGAAIIETENRVEPVTKSKPQSHSVQDRKLPTKAVVIQTRIPNIYDHSQLWLREGDIVNVLKINENGQWEGELNGKVGNFPFVYIKFLDGEETENLI